ncbi:MAG: CHASE2 domain-containing protein [Pirellulaceae bacterium]
MNPLHHRPDRYGVVMTLVIVLSVWTVNSLGLFRFADDCLSDLTSAFSARSYAPDNMLLVYAPAALLASDDELARLVDRISEHQPCKIAIVSPVSRSQSDLLKRLACADNLIVGYKNDHADSTTQANADQLAPLSAGYLDLLLDGQAVYRNHRLGQTKLNRDDEFKTQWSIEAVVASQVANEASGHQSFQSIPRKPVGIRFFGGVSGLPNVSSQELLAGDVIPEMVSNRIVLIGPQPIAELGFVTPTTRGADRMSQLELHGNILQTLLQDNYIVSLSDLGVLGVIFCVPMICVHCFRNLANRWMIRSWLALLLFVCTFSWVVLSLWSVRLPVTAMLTAVAMSFVSVLYLRFRVLRELVDSWRMLRSTTQRIKSSTTKVDRWEAMADSVQEVFDPLRIVLMKLNAGSTHLEITQLRGCQSEDIREKRRDVHRFPFSAAIDQNYPTQVDDRQFLNEQMEIDGREFMVPLVMVSEVIGFMVIEMDAAVLERWSDFESCLARYSNDMAIFLAGKDDDESIIDDGETKGTSSLALPERAIAASLIKDEIQHRSYSKMLAGAIESAETAIAIGDVFGQLVTVNEKMIMLLQRDDLSTQDTSCVELLSKLTQRQESECRKLFRRCIIEDRAEQIVLASKSAEESSSVLFVRPLVNEATGQERGMDSRFVAIEIVSGEAFDAINHWQRQFLSAQSQQIDRQMQLLLQIAGDLEIVKRDGGSNTDPYVAMARDVLNTVNECRAATGNNLTDSPADYFLLDTRPILDAAIRDSEDELTRHGVTIRHLSSNSSDSMRPANAAANPFLLEQVFTTIIDCLVADCDEQTELIVQCDKDKESVKYQFSTQSNGIETTELERCLFGATEADRTMLTPREEDLVTQRHLDRLRESNRWLRNWGAKLAIQCDAFYRVSVSLSLLTSPPAPSAQHPTAQHPTAQHSTARLQASNTAPVDSAVR